MAQLSCQTTFSLSAVPRILRPRFTDRNTGPSVIAAAVAQESIVTSTHVGIGTVRTRQCFPTRSTMHQRPIKRQGWWALRYDILLGIAFSCFARPQGLMTFRSLNSIAYCRV